MAVKSSEQDKMDRDPLLHPSCPSSALEPMVSVVDYRGRPLSRSASGGWNSALFIIVVEIAERFAFYGISTNLISYLTGPLHESTAAAATAVNAWSGTALMTPFLGAFLADSYLGRYRTIVLSSLVYILGLGMLTVSTVLPALQPKRCGEAIDPTACTPSPFQVTFFYLSLYLVALAQGGHKPCVQAFGADQFDQNDPKERVARSSFFNWWYFGMCGGILVAVVMLSYVQDNIGWGLGFGIPGMVMLFAIVVFLLGTKTYRFYLLEEESPFARIGKTLFALGCRQLQGSVSNASEDGEKQQSKSFDDPQSTSAITEVESPGGIVHEEEEAKGVLRLFPIWATCLIYAIVFAQSSTFFTKQGSTLDRRIVSNLQVPPAALYSFTSISTVILIPIYDRIIVPMARKFSSHPSGFTMLQRIGGGMVLSLLSMAIAALVETRRLKTARDYGLVDQPKAMVPMSLWWLVPQYVLHGFSHVFTMVGLQEFFYDQVPDALRSLGLALYLSIFGIGSFISGFLISVIDKITSRSGDSWFSNNLNRAHLDYFYWLLAALSALELVLYTYFAKAYVYKKRANCTAMS